MTSSQLLVTRYTVSSFKESLSSKKKMFQGLAEAARVFIVHVCDQIANI